MSYTKIGTEWRGYYITAYGIAVKHGFIGTEEEWLASLKGDGGEPVVIRYSETDGQLQWKYENEDDSAWREILTLADLQGDLVSATISQAQAAKTAAEAAKTAAQSAASSAQTDASTAQTAAATASTKAAAAAASEQTASGAADTAQEAATKAENAQKATTTNATQAAQSATDARTAKAGAESAASNAAESEAAAKTAETNAKKSEASVAADSAAATKAAGDAANAQTAAEAARDEAVGSKTAAAASAASAGQDRQAAQAAKAAAETAKTDAQAAATDAQESAELAQSSAQGVEANAKAAESWAVGGTGTREGENTNNAKYWCDSAQAIAGGGVTSFNGRGGAVVPKAGDYTAEMVGADAAGTAETKAGAVQGNLDDHEADTTKHVTAAERTKWNGKQDKLTFDAAPTANSTNPVTSGGVKAELDKKANATSLGAHTGNTDNPHQVTAAQVGADPAGTGKSEAASAVSAHNSSSAAHSDIRTALAGKETAGAAATVQGNLDDHEADTTKHVTAAERTKWNGKQDKLTFDAAPTANSTNPVTSGGVKAELDKKANATSLGAHTGNTDNPHQVTAAQVGADPAGTGKSEAASAVSAHNSSNTAHSDIRTALAGKEAAGAAAAVQGNLDDHEADTTKHVTAAERTAWNAKSGKAVSFTVTLAAASWSSKAQTVSNANILTGAYAYVVSPAPASFGAYSEAIIYADNVTQAGKMTFHCSQTPTAALTVNITRIEVGT